jgi:RNA polymerase sigma factor (TIGR02999 family)
LWLVTALDDLRRPNHARRLDRREDDMGAGREQVTLLLGAIERGEAGAFDELFPLVYDELRARAGALMAGERRGHTLQRTALVHESYLKLVGSGASFRGRLHFFCAAAQAMRRILVDHAERKHSLKRGGGRARVDLDAVDVPDDHAARAIDWQELDEALHALERASPRQHQVVLLRFFSGRTEAEVAETLQVSEPTVRRDWATARTWLYRAMRRSEDE